MDDLLQEGVKAYRAGKNDEARKLFASAIKQNPNDERVWGWMYNVCINNKERIHCLQQMIRINPENEKANQLLKELTASDFPLERPSAEIPKAVNSQPIKEQKISPSAPSVQPNKNIPPQKVPDPKQQKNIQIGFLAVLFLCVICLCIVYMPSNLNTFSTDPLTKLCADIEVKLGRNTTQQDVKNLKYCNFEEASSEISVTFIGNENFTDDLTKLGIRLDLKDVLQIISQSNTSLPYRSVVVVATYPYVDVYGTVTDVNIVIATYNRESIEKVNWETFMTDNIYSLANQDSLYIHPDFIP